MTTNGGCRHTRTAGTRSGGTSSAVCVKVSTSVASRPASGESSDWQTMDRTLRKRLQDLRERKAHEAREDSRQQARRGLYLSGHRGGGVEVPDVMLGALTGDARHVVLAGGRARGASWAAARYVAVELATKRCRWLGLRETEKSQRESMFRVVLQTCQTLDIPVRPRETEPAHIEVIDTGSRMMFFGIRDTESERIKSFEDLDGVVVEEAQQIGKRSLWVLRPTLRKKGVRFIWPINPRYSSDPVYAEYIAKRPADSELVFSTYRDNPWFAETELEEQRLADFAADEAYARHVWDGELLDQSEDQLLSRAEVEEASKREPDPVEDGVQISADVAHMGGDEIVIYRREGVAITEQSIERRQPYTATAQRIARMADGELTPVVLDAGGGGMAVAEILRDVHGMLDVSPVYFGSPAHQESRYANRITEIACDFRDQLPHISIPDDPDLRDQLLSREIEYVSNQRLGGEQIRLVDKRKAAKKLGRSPDRGDACMLAFARVAALRFPKLNPWR